MTEPGARLANDWYDGVVPANVVLGRDVYVDSSYAFTTYRSTDPVGLRLGDRAGVYDRTTFVVGPRGRVDVGAYTCLNGTYIVCNDRVSIGAHCFLAWGVVLTDSWPDRASAAARRATLREASCAPERHVPAPAEPRPITVEDNVWVGFDAVVLPGVTLGRGCVVGCKAVVTQDVPPYAVVVGDPARVVRRLEPTDGDDVRERAIRELVLFADDGVVAGG